MRSTFWMTAQETEDELKSRRIPNAARREYRITFGKSTEILYTYYHAEQFMRALRLNGTACTLEIV